ncbi:MAG: hypothetical protein KDC92_06200 [Bacteroidetes bacterium]|nr:hypothetical protein [Bacteroidota bacterium]
MFKEGSWWIYESKVSSSVDSVYCNQSKESDKYDDTYGSITTFITIKVKSSLYGEEYSFSNQICSKGESADLLQQMIYIFKSGSLGPFPILYFDPSRWDFLECGPSSTSIAFYGSHKELDGYENVRVFESSHSSVSFPTITHWAKNIGIVKKIMPDGTEWVLKDYHVIQ